MLGFSYRITLLYSLAKSVSRMRAFAALGDRGPAAECLRIAEGLARQAPSARAWNRLNAVKAQLEGR